MVRLTFRKRTSIQVDRLLVAPNIFGDTWYVDVTNGNNNNQGQDPKSAFATLAQARSSSAAGDTIVIAPGTYPIDVSAASLAPKANQKWMAANPARGGATSVIIVADADDSANAPVAVDVNNVHFEGIEFKLVAGGTTALFCLDTAQTSAVRGLSFDDCWFNLNSVDAAGVIACRFNDATNAITGLSLKRCRFVGGDGTTGQVSYIQIGVGGLPDGRIEQNTFVLESADGDCYGLDFLDPGATAKSYALVVKNNDFVGPKDAGADGVGIFFAAAMTETEIVALIHDNHFAYCSATPITIDKINKGVVRNYVGDNAAGGTLVDPGT